ncbi:MAG TPA: TonB-dependent receptor [Chitinophagaceae bacterium]|jgi:outer membrane receptor protein involved in Fe transport|nr:TonB-dependent receptor [Chitinophagaceae bacterium]
MNKSLRFLAAFLTAVLLSLFSYSQSAVLSGNVKNVAAGESVPAVSVTVKDVPGGTFTDSKGDFKLSVPKLPVVLQFSSVGYESKELTVESASSSLQVDLTPASSLGQEVVVSASRVPERILESPVTVERVSAAAIRNSPAAAYYDILGNIKGVDITTSSLTFKTPSTRGFSGSGNLRFNQLVDGMDNQAPGLNFSVGGVIGISELDVESMELLPGASSALYGPGGMNGTLLINSKNPFRYQGLSFQAKQGIMHTDGKYRDPSPYYNWSLRWAKAINNKFAFKIATELISAKDWVAADERNYLRLGTTGAIIPGTRESDPNYDGVNVYGDETTIDIMSNVLKPLRGQAPFLRDFINGLDTTKAINVSRTGYRERDVVDPNTVNYKVSGALHYKLTPATEAIFAGYWGTGNTVYTGNDRYSLKELKIAQYKLELNNKNWFLRAYTTQENAGQSYFTTTTTRLLNEVWKPSGGSTGWYSQYGQAYLNSKLGGATDIASHAAARAAADVGRPVAGTTQFKQIFDEVRSKPISKGGGLFLDKTDLYNFEGQYNLSSITSSVADIVIGANFKKYVLNSEGTIFADSAGKISIDEVGAYVQASRSFMDNRFKLTFSGRYDKNENFAGRFTPRITGLLKVAENNNLRLSYQTAYRFPSTQQQWIDLDISPGVKLVGGVQEIKDFYNFSSNPIYGLASLPNAKVATFERLKPESVKSYELGYKSLIRNKILIDLYGYYGQYTDFIVRTFVVQSNTGNPAGLGSAATRTVYSVPTNSPTEVKTYGYGFSIDYALPAGFTASANLSYDNIDNIPAGFVAAFNAPKYRTNIAIGNTGLGKAKKLGFNVIYKWQDSFFYEGDFANGKVNAIQTVDAQVSYKLPAKSVVKIGATNLLNQYYRNAAGNPSVGGLYYVSYGYNIF